MHSRTERMAVAGTDPQRAIRLWLAVGWFGLLALPWYSAPQAPWL